MKKKFVYVKQSLMDLLGKEYIQTVCHARSAVSGEKYKDLMQIALCKIDFFPVEFQNRLQQLLPKIGTRISQMLSVSPCGASTHKFNEATRTDMAPLSGFGYYRVGENGRLYITTKSEHYHVPLGHCFPGYALLNNARKLGISNATHNNTRGYITRMLEETLINSAGLVKGVSPLLNRVLNLETGSIAVEAALKMILSRFYKLQDDVPEPQYKGKTPVFVVVGNDDGGLQANYHGTTVIAQILRGMWENFYSKLNKGNVFVVKAVRPNNKNDLYKVFKIYDKGKYKISAFLHEIVMMNYGGILLKPDFLHLAYDLCKKSNAATVNDEIQSCLWHHELFMFKEWKLRPSFVAIGKGFPNGEYAASRLLFDSQFDTLPQFGALVTNGQEEIASLAYLITMTWAKANADVTRMLGERFEERLRECTQKHRTIVTCINGKRHMVGIVFKDLVSGKKYSKILNNQGVDISVQAYKTEVPPVVLLKLPLIMDEVAIDWFIDRIDKALVSVENTRDTN